VSASVRDRIVDAAIAALNASAAKPTGAPAVDDTRMEPYAVNELPAVTVFELREEDEYEKSGRWAYFLKRTMTLRVEIRVAGDPPRKVIDPLYVWAGKALAGQQFGGLAEDCIEALSEWQYADNDQPYALLSVDFRVFYVTLKADPTATQ